MKNTVRVLNHNVYGKFVFITAISGNTAKALSSNRYSLDFFLDDVAKMPEVGHVFVENVVLSVHGAGGVHQEITGDRYWSNTETDDEFEGHEYAEDAFFRMVENFLT